MVSEREEAQAGDPMHQLAHRSEPTIDGLERVLLDGDLSGLVPDQRVAYYGRVCQSVGLNPLTQPFEYLRLNGKTILYAKRAATDQLRKVHNVSVRIVSRETTGGVYVVTAQASTPTGRCDESIGAVPVEGLKGENLANALMKAESKAKRRVTLALCGLSMLDELEVESVQRAQHEPKELPTPATRHENITNRREARTHNAAAVERVVRHHIGYLADLRTTEELVEWAAYLKQGSDTSAPADPQMYEIDDNAKKAARTAFGARCAALGFDPKDLQPIFARRAEELQKQRTGV